MLRKCRWLPLLVAAAMAIGGCGVAGGYEQASKRVPAQEGASEAVAGLLRGLPQRQLVLGAADAPVTLVEFADLQSPISALYAKRKLVPLIRGPIRDGKAKLEFRSYAIIGPQSTPAAEAMVAAGEQGRGWSFIELFFRNQGRENSGYVTGAFLRGIAKASGVENIARWEGRRRDDRIAGQIQATRREAEELGFGGVPSFAIDGPSTEGLEPLGTPSSARKLIEAIESAG